jgi:hypothetical protein
MNFAARAAFIVQRCLENESRRMFFVPALTPARVPPGAVKDAAALFVPVSHKKPAGWCPVVGTVAFFRKLRGWFGFCKFSIQRYGHSRSFRPCGLNAVPKATKYDG